MFINYKIVFTPRLNRILLFCSIYALSDQEIQANYNFAPRE